MSLFRQTNWMLATVLLAACGAEPADPVTQGQDAQGEELSAEEVAAIGEGKTDLLTRGETAALPPGAKHLYFGLPGIADLTEDADGPVREDLAYRWFVAKGGNEFKVGAAVVDGQTPVPGVSVGFKLQRLARVYGRYQWIVVGQGSGDGAASLRYLPPSSPATRVYLLTATASPLPQQLRISLGCRDFTAKCAVALQPGDTCGGRSAGGPTRCDEGLYCKYELAAQCGAGDQTGVCEVRPQICARGIRYTPVCGCDGQTHDAACGAAAAGTSVLRTGPCEVDLVGSWTNTLEPGARYSYQFDADGTFTSSYAPACLFARPPCAIRQQLLTGRYEILGTTSVSLEYTEPGPGGAVLFEIQGRGAAQRLVGNDFGRDLSLQHVR